MERPLPVRNDVVALDLPRAIVHGIRDLLAGVENFEILEAVAAEFREGGGGLGRRSALAHDQLVLPNVDLLVLHQVRKRARAADGDRHGLVLAIKLGQQLRALDGEPRPDLQGCLSQSAYTLVHISLQCAR